MEINVIGRHIEQARTFSDLLKLLPAIKEDKQNYDKNMEAYRRMNDRIQKADGNLGGN